jgi:chromosomal replication initiator protein
MNVLNESIKNNYQYKEFGYSDSQNDSQNEFFSYIWEQFLILFEKEQGRRFTNHWIKNLSLVSWSKKSKNVVLEAPNTFTKEWVEKNFIALIEKLFCRLLNEFTLRVSFIVKTVIDSTREFTASHKESKSAPFLTTIHPDVRQLAYSNNYIVTKKNEGTMYAIDCFLKKEGIHNPLFFVYGDFSTGKTFLLKEIQKKFQYKKKIFYFKATTFTSRYVAAAREKNSTLFGKELKQADVLLIDDIELFSGKQYTQKFLLRIIEHFDETGKKIIFSASNKPGSLPGILSDIVTYLQKSFIFKFFPLSYEEKKKIIMKYCHEKKYSFDEASIDYLMSKKELSLDDIQSLIDKVFFESVFSGRKVSLEAVINVVSEVYGQKKKYSTVKEFITAMAGIVEVAPRDIVTGKMRRHSLYKHIALYLLRDKLSFSYKDIMHYFTYKDHTTITYACKKIKKEYDKNPCVRKIVDALA